MYRMAIGAFLVALLGLIAAPAVLGAEKTVEGKIVAVAEGQLVMTDGADEQLKFAVGKDAKITLDGQDAALADLQAGFRAKVTTNDEGAVTRIEASSK